MTTGLADQELLVLLDRVRLAGIRLDTDGDRLTYRADHDVDRALLDALTFRRKEVVAFLLATRRPADPTRPLRKGPTPPSSAQLQIWALEQSGRLGHTYHLPLVISLPRRPDTRLLGEGLGRLAERHASLRTVFVTLAGVPTAITLPEVCLDSVAELPSSSELVRLARQRFDLESGPLLRAAIAPSTAGYDLLLCAHHIIADGYSMAILAEELLILLAGRTLPSTPQWEYADFARWEASGAAERQPSVREIAEALQQYEPLFPLATDRPRPTRPDYAGGNVELAGLSADLVGGLARDLQASPADILVAGWGTALCRSAGEERLVLGLVDAGRPFPALERVVGNFVNVMPLPLRFEAGESFAERVGNIARLRHGLRAKGHVPFLELARSSAPQDRGGYNPVFQHAVAWNDFAEELPARLGAAVAVPALGGSRFETLLSARVHQGTIDGQIEFASAIFERSTITRLGERFAAILAEAAADPSRPASAVDRIVMARIAPARQAPVARCQPAAPWPDVLLATAVTHPARAAVLFEDQCVTYESLAKQASAIGEALQRTGVVFGDHIAVIGPSAAWLQAVILGIWSVGAAYVPFDPVVPVLRLREMVAAAGIRLVLRWGECAEDDLGCPALHLDAIDLSGVPGRRLPLQPPEAVAYILHSSGSTGQPKPIAVSHGALAHFIGWGLSDYCREELREVLALTATSFDISLFELLLPLAAGMSVRIDTGSIRRLERPIPEGVTLLNTVPSVAAALLDSHPLPSSLRTANLAGEPLSPDLAERLHQARPGLRLCNLYGPTETTIYATAAEIQPGGRITIGTPVAPARVALLDAQHFPVAAGDPGELAIGGPLVAIGYINDPARTAACFVPDPDGDAGGRRYLTGDRARLRPSGLDFLGRRDRQVKVNGVRIELGDVEAALSKLPEAREVYAFVVPGERTAPPHLAGLVVSGGRALPEGDAVRRLLALSLPSYMIPRVIPVAALPRLANGKIDHAGALEMVRRAGRANGLGDGPSGELEIAVAEAWADVLGGDLPRRDDHFFASGGDSLAALRLVHLLAERLSVQPDPATLFEHPLLMDLAAAIALLPRQLSPDEQLLRRIEAMPDSEVKELLRSTGGGRGPPHAS